MAGACTVLALLKLRSGSAPAAAVLVAAALVFASFALVRPAALTRANVLWFQLGALLNRITSPVIMTLLFWVAITPLALLMRIVRRRHGPDRFDRAAASYWITRRSAQAPGSMRKQF
jgi:hypothetical protein